MDDLLKVWFRQYNKQIRRYHRAIEFYNDPEIEYARKEEHWGAFREILGALSEIANIIQKDYSYTMSPEEWDGGFQC